MAGGCRRRGGARGRDGARSIVRVGPSITAEGMNVTGGTVAMTAGDAVQQANGQLQPWSWEAGV